MPVSALRSAYSIYSCVGERGASDGSVRGLTASNGSSVTQACERAADTEAGGVYAIPLSRAFLDSTPF